jgi:hypothetical protein
MVFFYLLLGTRYLMPVGFLAAADARQNYFE